MNEIASELFEKLDDCITTFYPDYGFEWDKEDALKVIQAALGKAYALGMNEVLNKRT